MKQDKVLIAGVAGFIGSYLAESLIQAGIKVVGVDNWTTGSRKSIEHLLSDPLFDFIELNINQRIPESFFKEEWLAIVHTANVEAVSTPQRLELNELLTNSFGVKNLLDLTLRTKSRFVLTSTIDIYHGLASHTDLSTYYENVEGQSILTLSEAKRYAEALCQEYVSLYGLDVRIARLSDVYGPRMNLQADTIIARILSAALDGNDVVIDEVGSRMMYATYYTDVVYGLNKLVLSHDSKLKGGIFYFVNKEPVSLLSVSLTVKEYSRHDITVEFLPRVKDPLFALPTVDVSKSRNELYWEPKISLQEGIKKTMVYYLSENQPMVHFESKDSSEELDTAKKKEDLIETAPLEDVDQKIVKDAVEVEEKKQDVVKLPRVEDQKTLPAPNGWLALKDTVKKRAQQPILSKEAKEDVLQTSNKITHWSLRLLFASVVFIFIWFCVVPIVGLGAYGAMALVHYNRVLDVLTVSDFERAEKTLNSLSNSMQQVGKYWNRTQWFWRSIDQQDVHAAGIQGSLIVQEFSKAGQYGVAVLETLEPWWAPTIAGKDSQEYADQRTKTRIALAQSEWGLYQQHISVVEQLVNDPVIGMIPFSQKKILQGIDTIKQVIEITRFEPESLEYFPAWLGYEGKQSIVVLLQNSAEIRATGGFIGSYALITVNNGIISGLSIDDIYNPDGQLQEKKDTIQNIIAPEPINTYLAPGPLTLRDSNWWPHFPTSADAFARLFPQATGVVPDWVVGVNLYTIVNILEAIGPITLPVTNETVSADTLFEQAQTASEQNFEPGSTAKRDFIGQVAQQIWTNLFPMEGVEFTSLGKVITNALGTGQIIVYSTHAEWQSVLNDTSVLGNMIMHDKDYIAVVSSNVGNNKANNWVTRATDYEVAVDRNGNLQGILVINFVHSGKSETWPNGPYKDFLRVYVPEGAQLLETEGLQDVRDTYAESGKQVFAGYVDLPVGQEKKVVLRYSLPEKVSFSVDNKYELLVQGQPGILEESFTFSMQLPFFLKAESASPQVHISGESLLTWENKLRNINAIEIISSEL